MRQDAFLRRGVPWAGLLVACWCWLGPRRPAMAAPPAAGEASEGQAAKRRRLRGKQSSDCLDSADEQMAHIDTLVFDVDDTMYPVTSGFSDHRNNEVIRDFLVERLGFSCPVEAMRVRNEYFRRYHSTMKGLKVADQEGRLPSAFSEQELADWFADRCDFQRFLKPEPAVINAFRTLRDEAGLNFVAFSNAPRRYVLNCLKALGVQEFFPERQVFGVDDVLPACKPEAEAFHKVLQAVGSEPGRAVMFEDSMKNIRACHALGMHTVLVDTRADGAGAAGGEAALLADAPCGHDPAVGAVLQSLGELRERLPELWQRRFQRASGHRIAAVVP